MDARTSYAVPIELSSDDDGGGGGGGDDSRSALARLRALARQLTNDLDDDQLQALLAAHRHDCEAAERYLRSLSQLEPATAPGREKRQRVASPQPGPSGAHPRLTGWHVELRGQWTAYSMRAQLALEFAWHRGDPAVQINEGGHSYTVSFSGDRAAGEPAATQRGKERHRRVVRLSCGGEPPLLAAARRAASLTDAAEVLEFAASLVEARGRCLRGEGGPGLWKSGCLPLADRD